MPLQNGKEVLIEFPRRLRRSSVGDWGMLSAREVTNQRYGESTPGMISSSLGDYWSRSMIFLNFTASVGISRDTRGDGNLHENCHFLWHGHLGTHIATNIEREHSTRLPVNLRAGESVSCEKKKSLTRYCTAAFAEYQYAQTFAAVPNSATTPRLSRRIGKPAKVDHVDKFDINFRSVLLSSTQFSR